MMAGYDPDRTTGAGIIGASHDSGEFTMVADNDGKDNDNDKDDLGDDAGVYEPGELKTVSFSLYDAYGDKDTDMGRKVGKQRRALAENVEEVEFLYTLDDGSQTRLSG